MRKLVLAMTAAAAMTVTAAAGDLKVVGWNVESGGAKRPFIVQQIENFQGVDLWGFSEVSSADAAAYAAACGVGETGPFNHFLGTTGGADRLMLVYNADKLEPVGGAQELTDLGNPASPNNSRAPLFATFKEKATGVEFTAMVNHLQRGNQAKRLEQAKGLEAWAKTHPRPAVLLGDYNFDFNLSATPPNGNPAFVAMTDENVFRWVQPAPLRATHKGSQNSILDFVFLSGAAKSWTASSTVVTLADDASDTVQGSDHRPLAATITVSASPPPSPAAAVAAPTAAPAPAAGTDRQRLRNAILRKIEQLDRELVELRRLVRQLADDE